MKFPYQLDSDLTWSLMGGFLSRFSLITTSLIVANILNVSDFGIYSVFRNLMLSFTVLFNFGLTYVITKVVSELNKNIDYGYYIFKYIQKRYIIINIIIALIIIFFNNYISIAYFNLYDLKYEIIISVIYVCFNNLTNNQNSFLFSINKVKTNSLLLIITSILTLILSLFLGKIFEFKGTLIGLMFPQLILYFINMIIIKRESKSYKCPKNIIQKYLVSKIYHNLRPFFFQEILFFSSSILFNYILIHKYSYNDVSYLNIAMQISAIILFVPSILKQYFLMKISKYSKIDKINIFYKNLKINTITVLILSVIFYFLSENVVKVYGNNYKLATHLVKIYCIISIFLSITETLINYLISIGKLWLVIIFKTFKEIIFFVLLYFFISEKSIFYLTNFNLFVTIIFCIILYSFFFIKHYKTIE
jgi:O-antigen/teichoic acid export membrane protein